MAAEWPIEVNILLYLVIETFKTPGAVEVYQRAKDAGRLLPDGLQYISSWVDFDFKRCFQLMHADQEELFDEWIHHWNDLVEFEVIPVRTSAAAMEVIKPLLK
jgi:uncharacterized protein DUF3303